jgi:hypothetical protein
MSQGKRNDVYLCQYSIGDDAIDATDAPDTLTFSSPAAEKAAVPSTHAAQVMEMALTTFDLRTKPGDSVIMPRILPCFDGIPLTDLRHLANATPIVALSVSGQDCASPALIWRGALRSDTGDGSPLRRRSTVPAIVMLLLRAGSADVALNHRRRLRRSG